MSVAKRRQRWRWSAHVDGRPTTEPRDVAGEVSELNADLALEAVAREQGCYRTPQRAHFWRSGGWATYTNQQAETVTVVVVVTDPKRGES